MVGPGRALHRARCCAAAGAIALGALAVARPAEAHASIGEVTFVPVLGNLAFTIYDLVAIENEDVDGRWLVAQAVWTTPQALVLGSSPFWVADHFPPIVFFSIWTGQLASFAFYGIADTEASPASIYGLSWAIGANVATTSYATALALKSELAPPLLAVTQLVTTVPQIAVATYALASPSAIGHERNAVLVLGAWSSVIFAHGVASLFLYSEKPEEPAEAPAAFKLTPTVIASRETLVPALLAAGRF